MSYEEESARMHGDLGRDSDLDIDKTQSDNIQSSATAKQDLTNLISQITKASHELSRVWHNIPSVAFTPLNQEHLPKDYEAILQHLDNAAGRISTLISRLRFQ